MIQLGEKTVKARKAHKCHWCSEVIEVGSYYRRWMFKYDDCDKPETVKCHLECLLAALDTAECGEFELTGECGRGSPFHRSQHSGLAYTYDSALKHFNIEGGGE